MLNYFTASYNDISRGIDQKSIPNLIPDGYSQDLVNVVPNAEGHISKRTGYQGYYGYVPLRSTKVEYTGDATDNIIFTLDSSINLVNTESCPILAYGKLSSTTMTGDFDDDGNDYGYYEAFTVDQPIELSTGAAQEITSTAAETGILSNAIFVGLSESTDSTTLSNSRFLYDRKRVDAATYTVDIDYDNLTGSAIDSYIYFLDKSEVAGSVYHATLTGVSNLSIPAATHNLTNFNILVECEELDGGEYKSIEPDSISINQVTGQVDVTFSSVIADGRIILTSTPISNFATGTIESGSSSTIDITGPDTAFMNAGCYLVTVANTLEAIIPDAIIYDATTNTTSIHITNITGSATTFEIYYEFANISVNALKVTGTVTATGTDNEPQITLWGISHSGLYNDTATAGGKVNHIDSYRSVAESRLLCGLGGNIFRALDASEIGSTYAPTYYINLRNRINADTTVAPCFQAAGTALARSRGSIESSTISSNKAVVSEASYNSGTGYMDYIISLPDKSILDSAGAATALSNVISATVGLEDYLTVTQMGHSRLNGTFKIAALDDTSADTITISVVNSSIDSSDYDETDAGGWGAVYTDRLTFSAASTLQVADKVNADVQLSSDDIEVVSVSGATIVVSGVTRDQEYPSGLRVFGTRTGTEFPLRTVTNVSSTANLVKGDMLNITGFNQAIRITDIDTANDTITLDESIMLSDSATSSMSIRPVGRWYTVEIPTSSGDLPDPTRTYHFDTDSYTEQSTLRSTMIQDSMFFTNNQDEILKFDGTNIYRAGFPRWQPNLFANIDLSTSSFVVTSSAVSAIGDGSATPANRFTVSAGQIALFNVGDQVYHTDDRAYYTVTETDDDNNYVFVSTNITGSAINTAKSFASATNVDIDTEIITVIGHGLQTGDVITLTTSDTLPTPLSLATPYYVIFISPDEFKLATTKANALAETAVNLTDTGTGTQTISRQSYLNIVQEYRYYFRLNAVDANNNILAGAATGSENFIVRVPVDGQIQIKIVGFPTWDMYDYDRIELHVYRTKSDLTIPYYLVSTLPLNFNSGDGYLIIQDGTPDIALTAGDLDEVSSVGVSPIPLNWAEPIKAKYITSSNNKLILGNVSGYPKYDITFRQLRNDAEFTKDDLLQTSEVRLLFRKDNTDTATTTNMVDRVAYEFVENPASISGTRSIFSIATTASTFTVATDTPHGLSAGNWVYLHHLTESVHNDLTFAGWYQVSAVTGSTLVFNNTTHGRGVAGRNLNDVSTIITATAPMDVPVLLGTDGNINLKGGNSDTVPYGSIAAHRLASAVNTSMRMTDIDISGYSEFSPWLMADSGDEFGRGRLIIRQPKEFSTDSELVLDEAHGTSYQLFVNNISRFGVAAPSEASVGAESSLSPSRLIVSYANYPEVFDGPDFSGNSIIDINSADGQDITGIIPFFADSSFGGSQKEGVLIVFKTESIYVVDINNRSVQKLDTRGLGCSFPYSITSTRNGVMFANRSGIYRLNYNFTLSFTGHNLDNYWLTQVNREAVDQVTAHHFALQKRYELSVPLIGESKNTTVLVYDHIREGEGQEDGAWTRFTNFDVTGWANLESDAFFATNDGQVFSVRRLGEVSDYRDDASAVAQMEILTKPFVFGTSGIRHKLRAVMSKFKIDGNMTGTTLDAAIDLSRNFQRVATFSVTDTSSTSEFLDRQVVTLRSSIGTQKFLYLQFRYRNSAKDEPVILAGMDFAVAPLSRFGIQQSQNNVTS